MRFLMTFLLLFSLPLQAQELTSEYEVLGYVDLTMNGEDRRMPVVVLPGGETSFAKTIFLNEEYGIKRFAIAGITPTEQGQWNFPMLDIIAFSHNQAMFRAINITYSTESFRDDYTFSAGTEDQTAQISNFVLGEDWVVEFDFRGTLIHRDRNPETGETTPQEGKDPVEISGHVRTFIPEAFRYD